MTLILIEADIQNEKRGNKKDKVKDENKKSNEIYINYKSIYENTLNLCLYYFKILEKCQHTSHGLSAFGN